MALFGNTPTASPFGSTANKPSAFGGLGSSTTTGTGQGGFSFGNTAQNQPQGTSAPSLFGTPAPTQTTSLFPTSTAQKPATSTFGATTQPQSSMFSSTAQRPATSMFGNTTQPQTQPPAAGAPLFGSTLGLSTQASQQQQLQQQQQQPQQQQSQFGLTTMVQPQGQPQEQSLSSSLWSPGRAITGGKFTHSLISTSQFTF